MSRRSLPTVGKSPEKRDAGRSRFSEGRESQSGETDRWQPIQQKDMSDLEAEVEQLRAEATERWDDQWTVRVQHFADGDANAFAFSSHGLDEDGHLVHDRLFILDSGETVVERVTMERSELETETLEAPTPTA
jgi:hypothetical protein